MVKDQVDEDLEDVFKVKLLVEGQDFSKLRDAPDYKPIKRSSVTHNIRKNARKSFSEYVLKIEENVYPVRIEHNSMSRTTVLSLKDE